MKYIYYPGCSLEGSAKEYDLSTRAFLAAMDVELEEIAEWTCCGASAAEAVSSLLALALPARNLALAEKGTDLKEVLVPCSACYLNLKKVTEKIRKDADLLETINVVLAEDDLKLKGGLRVRHLLDVVSVDLGEKQLAPRVQNSLAGLEVAPYYGCQCLRPYPAFDDPEAPRSMEALICATGARVFDWEMGAKCCGASHMSTKPEVGIELVSAILQAARGADAIVTVCPMCQMNLEAYQKKAAQHSGQKMGITILYLPQLLGLAVGLSPQQLRLDLNLAVTTPFRQKLRQVA
jgi:heterodisulfide reductase subunit B